MLNLLRKKAGLSSQHPNIPCGFQVSFVDGAVAVVVVGFVVVATMTEVVVFGVEDGSFEDKDVIFVVDELEEMAVVEQFPHLG